MAAALDERRPLAEVSDLSRAAGVLGWDQRVTMPPRGTEARAEQLSTLGRIAHERFTDDEIGRLLDAAEPHVESLPYDSDDREPRPRHAPRLGEGAAGAVGAPRRDDAAGRARAPRVGGGAQDDDFASFLPYLRTNVELKRRYVECFEWSDSPYTPLLDDYEPGMLTSEVSDVFAMLRPALTELVAAAPEVDASFLHGDFPPDAQRAFAERVLATMGFEDERVAARPDRASVLHVVLEPGRPPDDALPAGRPRVDLVDAPRGGSRPLRARHRRLAAPLAARRRAVARRQRVAEPDVGEPRRPQPAASGSTGTGRSRRHFPGPAATSSSTRSSARSTAPSRA